MTGRPGVTGCGVAIGGLVLSAAGISTFLSNEQAVNRRENRVTDLRDKLND